MLLDESLTTAFRKIHSTMHNLAAGVYSSQVGKTRYVVSVEAFLRVTTVISIHVKVAAHFTELSAPLMVHHDLLSPVRLSSSLTNSLSSHWQWWCWWTRNTKSEQRAWQLFLWLLHTHKQTCGKVMKRLLVKSKSWAVEDNDVLWSPHQCSMITKQTEIAAIIYVEC